MANDIMIHSKKRQKVEENLELWYALERRTIKVSQINTEYACERERAKWNSEVTESRV